MAEKKVIELEIKDNVSSLKSQLRQATAEVALMSEKFGATSKEAADAAKRAAELKDMIADAKDLTDAFNPDAKFNALSSSIGGVLNGFQAYEGAMGLIGVESKALQETLLKVQSAMALSQGIQGALEAKDNFIQLGAVVKNAFAGMTQGAKLFAVTGIGLLVTAIGLVIANWESVSEAIGLSNKEQEKYLKQQKAIAEEQKKQNEFVAKESAGFATLIARLEASNKGSKERKDLIKEINSQYGTTIKNLDDEASFQKQLNNELKNYLEYQRQKFIMQLNEEKMQKNMEVQQKLTKELAKAQTILNITQEDYNKSLKRADTINTSERTNLEGAKNKVAELSLQLENAKKRFEDYGRASNKASASIDDLTNSGKKYNETTKETISVTKDTEKYIISEGMKQREMDAENLKNYLADIEASKATYLDNGLQKLIDTRFAEVEVEKQTADEKRRIQNELKDAQINAEKQLYDAKWNFANGILDSLSTLSGKNKKVADAIFLVQKGLAIAQIIVDTQKEIAGYASNPTWSLAPDGGASIKIPAIAAAKLRAAGSIATIAATSVSRFMGGGGSPSNNTSYSTPSGGQSFTPQFNVVGSSGVNQLAQVQQQPVKAYITSGDVVSAMSLERNKLQKTSI